MNPTLEVLASRYSCRAFLPQVPERSVVEAAALAAGRAPSSKNTQPWGVEIATGAALERVRTALLAAFEAGDPARADYRYSPEQIPDHMMERARICGYSLFAHKGIERQDKAARRAHDRENYRLFGAPMLAVLTLPKGAERGNFLDAGLFLGGFLTGLWSQGIGSTPMFSIAGYPDLLRRELAIADDRLVVCCVAMGIPDAEAHVNAFRTVREPLGSILGWHDV